MKEKLAGYLLSKIEPRPGVEDGEPVRAFVFEKPGAEAIFIADEILRRADPCPACDGTGKTKGLMGGACNVCDGKGTWGEIAVCYRMRAVGFHVERALMHAGIPFVNLNGTSFPRIKHIQIAWQYIALVFGSQKQKVAGYKYVYRIASDRMTQPSDFKSRETGAYLKREGDAINHRWIGKKFLQKYPTFEHAKKAVRDPDLSGWKQRGVRDLLWTVGQIEDKRDWKKALHWIIERIVVPWYVKENGMVNDEDGSFADDMAVLVEIADGYSTATEFLQFIENILDAAENEKNKNAVILATFHKIKGQEYNCVFVAGMSERICPTVYALGLIPPTESGYVPPPPSNGGIIDERFCVYVGISRAKKVCTLTCSLKWRGKDVEPSRFIAEAGLILEGR